MTVNRWLCVSLILLLTYLSGLLIPENERWFNAATTMSFVSVFVISMISNSGLAILLIIIEITAFFLIGIAGYQKPYNGFVYTNLGVIINSMALVQAALLVIGGPWRGMADAIRRIFDHKWLDNILANSRAVVFRSRGSLPMAIRSNDQVEDVEA